MFTSCYTFQKIFQYINIFSKIVLSFLYCPTVYIIPQAVHRYIALFAECLSIRHCVYCLYRRHLRNDGVSSSISNEGICYFLHRLSCPSRTTPGTAAFALRLDNSPYFDTLFVCKPGSIFNFLLIINIKLIAVYPYFPNLPSRLPIFKLF